MVALWSVWHGCEAASQSGDVNALTIKTLAARMPNSVKPVTTEIAAKGIAETRRRRTSRELHLFAANRQSQFGNSLSWRSTSR